jgi:hypothetical protein
LIPTNCKRQNRNARNTIAGISHFVITEALLRSADLHTFLNLTNPIGFGTHIA